MSDQPAGFFVAPFVIDGELEGVGFWEFGKLSENWVGLCRSILDHHGESFDYPWEGNLAHIRMKVTGAAGAALVTFRVHGAIISSLALLSGIHRAAEDDLLRMFTASLKRVELTQRAAASSEPFAKILTLQERPLMIVVPWPNAAITRDDIGLVRELSTHLAAAFFQKVCLQPPVEN